MEKQKRIALINDFCSFGRCSVAVALPVISALKVQCCPLLTSLFSNHTAFPDFYKEDLTDTMPHCIEQWDKLDLHFDGILIGYLSSEKQIDIVIDFIKRFKGPDTLVVIDPIMGDGGKLYNAYSGGLSDKMARLCTYADVITPNVTEACILSGSKYCESLGRAELEEIGCKLLELGPKKAVVSGVPKGSSLQNYVFEKGKSLEIVSAEKIGPGRPGTGDIFSSVIAADCVKGETLPYAVKHATDFISKVLDYTCKQDVPIRYGVCFEEFLSEI